MRALAESHRREILALVRDQELSAGAIAERFRVTRPAISQHLAVLKQAGLISERREGTRRLYRARLDVLDGVRVYLEDLWDERLAGLKREAEEVERRELDERVAVEREIVISAKRQTVWELLVNPRKATCWMGQRARFDLRVGGSYCVEVLPELVAAGEFLEIDPPRRLVHTWGWQFESEGPVPPGSTIVVYELFDRGDQTLLRLRHRGLPSLDTAGSHSRGWAHYLPRLAQVASGCSPGADPWITDPTLMQRELRPASGRPPRRKSRKGMKR